MAAFFGQIGGWIYQRPYLLASLTYLFWAMNIVLGRHAVSTIPPVTLGFWRWAFAGLILLPFAWPYLKRDWPTIRGNIGILSFLGVTGTTGYAALSYWGLQYTEAINGLLIQCTMPATIGVASYLLVGERLSARQIAGITVSFVGVLPILMRGDLDVLHSISFNRGDVWFIGAMVVFALYSPLTKKSPIMHPLSFLGITIITGTLFMVPFYLWEIAAVGTPAIDIKTVSTVLYMAIFPSVLAYLCYNRGVQMLGPNPVAALYPLIVVFGSMAAITLLGERPEWYHLAGTVFIIGGVLLATRQRRSAVAAKA